MVARGWGKPCVCGCDELDIDEDGRTMTIIKTGEVLKEGDTISINGSTGEVIRGSIPRSEPKLDGAFGTLLGWADEVADKCKVMANADSGPDAARCGLQHDVLCGNLMLHPSVVFVRSSPVLLFTSSANLTPLTNANAPAS